jgi:hypothetical protein
MTPQKEQQNKHNNMEIELYSKLQNPIEAIDRLGEFFAKSGMFGCDKIEQGKVLAMACLTERQSPFQILNTYHLIQGRLSMRADAMLARFRGAGGTYVVKDRTADKAAITLNRNSQSLTFSLTWAEAQQERFPYTKDGKLKDNWSTPRSRMQMMWARVVSDGVRTLAPEINCGIYTPEEAADDAGSADRVINMTAPVTETTAPETTEPPVSKPSPKPAAAKKPKPETVDAEVVAETSAPTKPAEPKPEESTKPEPKPEPDPPPQEPTGSGQLPQDTVDKLESIIGEHGQATVRWLFAKGWIKKGQGLADMTPQRAARIIKQREAFIEEVKKA